MEKRAPNTPTCPRCGAAMRHVRTITHLGDLPDIEIFFCGVCSHVETVRLKRAA
jgi:hypothetical protein